MDAEQITTVARGISEYGILAIAGGAFILFGIIMITTFVGLFKSMMKATIDRTDGIMSDLLSETRAQNEMLADISEGLRPETLARIKVLSSALFELSKLQVCRMINTVRQENHIADHAATAAKIRALLHNMHEDRNSRLDNFTYRGHKLSFYTNIAWVEKIAQVFEAEIYNESGENNGRAHTNMSTAYDEIKLDFYHRLNQ